MPEYMQVNTLLWTICKTYAKRFDIHIVKQKEVVTCMSPEILNSQKLSLIVVSQGKGMELQSEQAYCVPIVQMHCDMAQNAEML